MQILSVGFEVPGGVVEHVPLESTRSLLDADLIVFAPGLGTYEYEKSYQGKPSLNEHDSFEVKERLRHWRRELLGAFDAGKFVLVFLASPEQAFAQTGEKRYSGTGRNRQTTLVVGQVSSYDALPLKLDDLVVASGLGMRPVRDLGFLASFWQEFGSALSYEVHFTGKFSHVLLHTKVGDRIVGAALVKNLGAMVVLPPFAFDPDKFVQKGEWSPEAKKFGPRLISALVEMAKALRSSREITPPPDWSRQDSLRSETERDLERQIGDLSKEIERIETSRNELRRALEKAGDLRRLLYEKGKQLEVAVGDALRLMDFDAAPFREGDSEFDTVFCSPEGRCLGEVEGKDNHAINIDKLSQLERNLQEDFAREEVTEYAKGVLFGNAFRLTEPSGRGECFTAKCKSGAKRAGVALVRTVDLYSVAQYLRSVKDPVYAKACREAIFAAKGDEVAFRPPPR